MRRKSAVRIGLMAVVIAGCAEQPPRSDVASSDRRRRLDLPVEAQDAIRLEMRTMLGSLSDILVGSARGDTAAMTAAAARSGLATAVDPALETLLPEEFLRLGTSTHRAFDELRDAIQAGAPGDSVLARLGGLTGNCVACHATYRLSGP